MSNYSGDEFCRQIYLQLILASYANSSNSFSDESPDVTIRIRAEILYETSLYLTKVYEMKRFKRDIKDE